MMYILQVCIVKGFLTRSKGRLKALSDVQCLHACMLVTFLCPLVDMVRKPS
jgi:hypothetical protein